MLHIYFLQFIFLDLFVQFPLPLFSETSIYNNMEVDLGATLTLEEDLGMTEDLVRVNTIVSGVLGLEMDLRRTYLEPQAKTTPSTLSRLRPLSPATARWTVDTTRTLKQSARRSTSAPATEDLA